MLKHAVSLLVLPLVVSCASGPTWVPQPRHQPMVAADDLPADPSGAVVSDPLDQLMEQGYGSVQAKAPGTMMASTMIYQKSVASVYQILTKPHHTTTVIFPKGEKISGPITGGKEMIRYQPYPEAEPTNAPAWVIAHGYSGAEGAQRLQVDIMPITANLQTTLVVRTDGGWYVLEVSSKPKTYYPMVAIQADDRRPSAQAAQARYRVPVSGVLGVGYEILTPDTQVPSWTPQAVWDDQAVTVFQFGRGLAQGEAPELYSVNDRGERMLVNTTPQGKQYLIAHRLNVAWSLKLGETEVHIRQTSDYGAITCPERPGCPITLAQSAAR